MGYLTAMGNILSFTPADWKVDSELKRLQIYCIINVLVLGLIYGISAAFFSHALMAGNTTADLTKVIVAGIPVAFFMHAGAALFIWVFLRAMGGKADFITAYFHIGAASISLWPLAPFVAILQIGQAPGLLLLFAGLFAFYAFAVNFLVIKEAFRLSALKMTLAFSVTLIYIGCFLYLWL